MMNSKNFLSLTAFLVCLMAFLGGRPVSATETDVLDGDRDTVEPIEQTTPTGILNDDEAEESSDLDRAGLSWQASYAWEIAELQQLSQNLPIRD